jgi:serine/threonine-protein kinase
MAPEQARIGSVNERTDVFNLGATMYRLVTWRLPPRLAVGEGGLPMGPKVWEKQLRPVLECNAETPPELADLIHRCLAYHPQNRPDRMSEVQEALDQLAEKLVRTHDDHLEALQW